MQTLRKASWIALTILLLALASMPVQGLFRPSDGVANGTPDDYVFVRFNDPPLASYNGGINGYDATKPRNGNKLNLNSPAAKKYGNRLQAQQQNYIDWLTRQHPEVQVVTSYWVTFNGLGLKLNGATLKDIAGGPGTAEANMSGTYHKAMNVSHGLINSGALWSSLGGQDGAGSGIKVGIIDTGIDAGHTFLRDTGMAAPAGFPRGDTRFTSNKVIVAKVFHQDPWQTAQAIDSHGTHVSGTVAGRAGTNAPMAQGLSGVAPGAWLGNYNVFPGHTEDAKSLFIAKAVEEAVMDGMDVLNLSLGGTPHQGADLLDMAVDAATDAGVVVAIAAGNEGPGIYTVGSPGTASNVITVAAITNSHTFAMFLQSAALAAPTRATTGTGGGELTQQMTGTYAVWADYAGGDKLACGTISGTPLSGKIALIQRGSCTFTEKINHAYAAGAVAVIVYQRDDQTDPIPMSSDGALIPAVMISRDAGYALRSWTGDRTVTMTAPPTEVSATPNKLADFSSWGPTPNYTLKPDVAAPGVNIYSSVPGGGFEVFQGTSMATPHVAGASALLLAYSRQHNLGWGPQEVKSALMGTGHAGADTDDPLKIGGGIIDLARAMNPPAMAAPGSLSFELVRPVGGHTYSLTFNLTNTSGSAQTYTLAEASGSLTVSPASVTLGAGQSAAVTATVADTGTPSPGQAGYPELHRGYVTVSSNAGGIRVPYLYVLDYNR